MQWKSKWTLEEVDAYRFSLEIVELSTLGLKKKSRA